MKYLVTLKGLPHPTYLYFKHKKVSIEILEQLALMFQRFEVLNGQRDVWQNLLTLTWLQGLDEEKITDLENKHGIQSKNFCVNPYRKIYTGGTDDHMGIFAGSCGTLVQVENLKSRYLKEPTSELVLEGLRKGNIAPYGYLGEVNEKLNIAFLDYFCQVTMNMKDPGLTRILLHKGETRDKLFCLGIANSIFELRRHSHTMGFMKTLHKAIRGKKTNIFKKLFISKAYRPIFEKAIDVSNSLSRGPEAHIQGLRDFFEDVYRQLNNIIATRLQEKFKSKSPSLHLLNTDWEDLVHRLEMPVHLRALVGGNDLGGEKMNPLSLGKVFDQLSFPLLATSVIAASTYTSTRVMFNSRYLLNDLAEHIQKHQHPKRILWLTDTLFDKNGVSMFLQELMAFVREQDLPIDFLVSGKISKQESHLHIIEQVIEFSSPNYSEQPLRIPNLMDIQKIFYDGAYDRVICSTEGIGWLGLYLKTAFSVPAYFYMHTDWMDFFKRSAHCEDASLSQIRRYLRFFYQQFDGVFVLNEDHRAWLTSQDMGLTKEKIHKTAHWPAEVFRAPHPVHRIHNEIPHLLYVGRLSEEKGVHDLALISHEFTLRGWAHHLTIVGDGPAKTLLKQNLPHANFVGWQNQENLVAYYENSDLLLLPSRFDTFGCVVIEAMHCGCPVVAYNCKGPKRYY
jgi:glycosyltransferase involved in cell wall biosynthesis